MKKYLLFIEGRVNELAASKKIIFISVTILSLLVILFQNFSAVNLKNMYTSESAGPTDETACINLGWQKINLKVNGFVRKVLYKPADKDVVSKGSIVVLHGGGGTASHFCSVSNPDDLIATYAQIKFAKLATQQGFNLFVLDSTDDVVTDAQGDLCGKRFDFPVQDRPNVDLNYIKRVITETIPSIRPADSSPSVYMVGHSTGAYMTIRAATHFDNLIKAFVPIAAGDPYGTYQDCNQTFDHGAKGILKDNETDKNIAEDNSCLSTPPYSKENKWETANLSKKPEFKQFHSRNDGIVDITCMQKATELLNQKGYIDNGVFLVEDGSTKTLTMHYWRDIYNQPILDFLKTVESRQTPTLKCAFADVAKGQYDLSLTSNKINRSFEVHIPTMYNGADPLPLLISYHGGGGTGADQRELTHFEQFAEKKGFIVVYPNGIFKSWNVDGTNLNSNNLAEKYGINDILFTSDLLTYLSSHYCIDPKKIYANGFSNGARFTQRLGCEMADKFAAIAAVAGAISPHVLANCQPSRAIPVIEFHGDVDPKSPYLGGFTDSGYPVKSAQETIEHWVMINQCSIKPALELMPTVVDDGTSVEIKKYRQCTSYNQVKMYTIIGGGHTWPKGLQYLDTSIIGVTSQQIDATQVIWNFLNQF